MIYFLQPTDGGAIKIGSSDNPLMRRKSITSLFPYGVELIASIEGSRIGESFLHHCFAPVRVSTEWFKACPPIWKLLVSVCDAGRPAFLPEEENWSPDRMRAEALQHFGDLETARSRLGYAVGTPVAQAFSSSGTSYAMPARLAFHLALKAGTLPDYIVELHANHSRSAEVAA